MAEASLLSTGVRLSLSALSQEFGCARETVRRRLADAGVKPDGSKGSHPIYRLRDCVDALTKTAEGEVENPKALAPMERRAYYASEKDRQIVEERDGLVIPAEDHRESLAVVIKGTVQMLEALPDLLERDCDLDPKQIERVERSIDLVRGRWADMLAQGIEDAG